MYEVDHERKPLVTPSNPYSITVVGETLPAKWWQSFADDKLDDLMKNALSNNLTLKQAVARIEQARAIEKQQRSFLFPELNANVDGSLSWPGKGKRQDNLNATLELSWEVDLWKRLESARKSSSYEVQAAQEDLHDLALILSTQVADNYYQIIEQKLQLELIEHQIKTNETQLELIELRFGQGQASSVDVYQQRQQIASLRTQIPPFKANLQLLNSRLKVLLGMSPTDGKWEFLGPLPPLPPLPQTGVPMDLLKNRPDLRKVFRQLLAADYQVAEAVADRLPRLRIGSEGGFRGSDFRADEIFISLFSQIIAPIIDWHRREAEQERREAIVKEIWAFYSEAYLIAIEEVENALWLEKYQRQLLQASQEELRIAKENLRESRNQYIQGLTDYLPVLIALQSVQALEQGIIIQRRLLISNRILLYRAIGGTSLLGNPKN